MEALKNDEDMRYILDYVNSKPNFYTGSEVSNVKSFFRNARKEILNNCGGWSIDKDLFLENTKEMFL